MQKIKVAKSPSWEYLLTYQDWIAYNNKVQSYPDNNKIFDIVCPLQGAGPYVLACQKTSILEDVWKWGHTTIEYVIYCKVGQQAYVDQIKPNR